MHIPNSKIEPKQIIFTGAQVAGDGRGATEVVPTINIELNNLSLNLEHGVYAAHVGLQIAGNLCWFKSATHFGPVPVYGKTQITLEHYIIDQNFKNEPYNKQNIQFVMVQKVRDILNFDSPALLVKQINKDILQIEQILQDKNVHK